MRKCSWQVRFVSVNADEDCGETKPNAAQSTGRLSQPSQERSELPVLQPLPRQKSYRSSHRPPGPLPQANPPLRCFQVNGGEVLQQWQRVTSGHRMDPTTVRSSAAVEGSLELRRKSSPSAAKSLAGGLLVDV